VFSVNQSGETENLKSTFGSTTMSGRIGLPSIGPARLFRGENSLMGERTR
jgi:hypothetical protein